MRPQPAAAAAGEKHPFLTGPATGTPVVNDRLQDFTPLGDLTHHCKSPQQEHELMGAMEAICTPG